MREFQILIPPPAWAFFSLPLQQDYWQTAFAIRNPKNVGKVLRLDGVRWFFMSIYCAPFVWGFVQIYQAAPCGAV